MSPRWGLLLLRDRTRGLRRGLQSGAALRLRRGALHIGITIPRRLSNWIHRNGGPR